jgi:hypothetical protein
MDYHAQYVEQPHSVTLQPDLSNEGPAISRVENAFAAKHGWTPDPKTRIWETNPTYQKYKAELEHIVPGAPPEPWRGSSGAGS